MELKLDLMKYADFLVGEQKNENEVIVSGGGKPPKVFKMYGLCGFAQLQGKGLKFKKFFERENERLERVIGIKPFNIFKAYPSGVAVALSFAFLRHIAEITLRKHKNLKEEFKNDIYAVACQDMLFKEKILNDIKQQIEKEFKDVWIWSHLD